MHFFLEKAFEIIEKNLEKYEAIYVDKNTLTEVKLLVVLKKSDSKIDLKDFNVTNNGISKKVSYKAVTKEFVKKENNSLYAIYDPQNLIEEKIHV